MKIFNTLTRRKEEFVPLEEGKVKMYVCGPTVYNLIHIGNARPMIIFDTVRRYMEYKGYEVNYVSNFTDVDDKIIKKAIEEGVSAEEISTRYIKECKKDMADMNVKPATTAPQATQEIQGMIDMIQTLIDKGYAYPAADGTVYFRVKKFKEYGKLSHKNLDDLQSGFRSLKVSGEDQKEDPLDFVLWKPKKEGEPSWPSPWCDGRPGWHIECSVMSKKYLGEQIDIHAGGEDLIFPHHENEIAQSEGCTGCHPFVKYWLHNGFITVNEEKMSKSLGNFFMVIDILEHYEPETLRFFILSTHYRSPLDFSDERLAEAQRSLSRLKTAQENLQTLMALMNAGPTEESLKLRRKVLELRNEFMEAMHDDFNTALAISHMFALAKEINIYHQSIVSVGSKPDGKLVSILQSVFAEMCSIIGVLESTQGAVEAESCGLEEPLMEMLIAMRQEARSNKDYAQADALRNKLSEIGIVLEDTPQGVRWKKQ